MHEEEVSYSIKLKLALQYYDETYEDVLFIVLEDIHILMGENWTKKLSQFPADGWKHIHLCCTVHSVEQNNHVNAGTWSISVIPVNYLQLQEKKEVINRMYLRHSKELSPSSIDALCKKTVSGYPLYLTLVLRSMLLLDENSFDELRLYIKDKGARSGVRIAESLTYYIETIPKDIDLLYDFLYEQSIKKADKLLIERIWGLISLTTFGLREQDLKEIITRCFDDCELEFYYVFHYVSYLLSIDHLGRYSLNNKVHVKNEDLNDLNNALINYIQSLARDDVIRKNELPILYASRLKIKECLTELSIYHSYSLENQTAFKILVNKYYNDLFNEISIINFNDLREMELVSNLTFSFSQLTFFGDDCFKLVNLVVSKCMETEDVDLNLGYKCGIFTSSAIVAKKTNHIEQARLWNVSAKHYLSKMKKINIPTVNPEISSISKALILHLEIMSDLQRARKCLDYGLSESLCLFILYSVKEKIDSFYHEMNQNSLGNIIIAISGILNSLFLYHELMGDLLRQKGDSESAIAHYIIAEDIERSIDEVPSKNHAAVLVKIGVIYEKSGNADKALQYYQLSYDDLVQINNSLNENEIESNIALTLGRIAGALKLLGDYKKAYQSLNNAAAVFEKIYKKVFSIESAGDYATCLFKIGELAYDTGEWIEEGQTAVLRASQIMYAIAKKTQDEMWMENLNFCIKLYIKLGGKL